MRSLRSLVALCALAAVSLPPDAHAATSRVLYEFAGGPKDAQYPYAGLIADKAANLYGTTYDGGSGACSDGRFGGCGAVFRLAPDGTETVLHSFQGGSDGEGPYASLIADKAGNLYGTTLYGGGDTQCYPIGCGTIFKLAPDGTETILHGFTGSGDGAFPYAALIADKSGNFYGTAAQGGGGSCTNDFGCGTVFELAADGTYHVLYEFTGENGDGGNPSGALLEDKSGYLYGTTGAGGDLGCSIDGASGCGTVFKLAPDGTETVLYAFEGGSDGRFPTAGVITDQTGDFYGTTFAGGSSGCYAEIGCGTVFKLAADGTETVLHAFVGGKEGHWPYAGLVADAAGNLYGTTFQGGMHKKGVVFELTAGGREKVLHAFEGRRYGDGVDPYAGLLMDAAGNLYGTTVGGGNRKCGDYGCGTVFEIVR